MIPTTWWEDLLTWWESGTWEDRPFLGAMPNPSLGCFLLVGCCLSCLGSFFFCLFWGRCQIPRLSISCSSGAAFRAWVLFFLFSFFCLFWGRCQIPRLGVSCSSGAACGKLTTFSKKGGRWVSGFRSDVRSDARVKALILPGAPVCVSYVFILFFSTKWTPCISLLNGFGVLVEWCWSPQLVVKRVPLLNGTGRLVESCWRLKTLWKYIQILRFSWTRGPHLVVKFDHAWTSI